MYSVITFRRAQMYYAYKTAFKPSAFLDRHCGALRCTTDTGDRAIRLWLAVYEVALDERLCSSRILFPVKIRLIQRCEQSEYLSFTSTRHDQSGNES